MAPVLIGLQLNVFSVELSVYCGPHCLVCPCPEETWLVHGLQGVCSAGNLTLSKLSIWEPVWVPEYVSLGSKVKATSFILLLGVGSFVCYRLFHQLKRRLAKGGKRSSEFKALPAKHRKLSSSHKRYLDYLLVDRDDVSNFCNSDFSDTSSCASYGDGETTSDSPSLTDGDSDPLVMGISSSNTFEPVYFSKASGIHFRSSGQKNSTPLDHLARNISRHNSPRKCHLFPNNEFRSSNQKENLLSSSSSRSFNSSGSYKDFDNSNNLNFSSSYDIPFSSQDAVSMHGNFSPSSLRERTLRTEQLISSNIDNISKSNHHVLKRDYSADSLTCNSELDYSGPASKRPLSRALSIDSEVSELCVELQREAQEVHEMGVVTVEKMENLEDEINDIKQSVLELDADLVGLQEYKNPPLNCWELTNISESEKSVSNKMRSKNGSSSGYRNSKIKMGNENETSGEEFVNKIVNSHSSRIQSPEWEKVCSELLDWDVSVDNPFENDQAENDSGSDFGNSLETDSPDAESVSINGTASESLEWDVNFVSEFGIYKREKESSRTHKVRHCSKHSVQSKSLPDNSELGKMEHHTKSIPLDEHLHQFKEELHLPSCTSKPRPLDLSAMSYSSSQISSPMTETKTELSPVQDGASSLFSDMTFSSAFDSKTKVSDNDRVSNELRTAGYYKGDSECLNNKKDSDGNYLNSIVKVVNHDSAFCEDSDFPEVTPVENVGPKVSIRQHSHESAVHQNIQLNQLLKMGYAFVEEQLNFTHIRRMKGDNYGIIRATLYQLLSKQLPIMQQYGGAGAVYQLLSTWSRGSYPWLLDWAFAENLPYNNSTCLQGFWECLHSLENMEAILCNAASREQHLAKVLNENPDLDIQLLEAVKLLMCISACRLYSEQASGSKESPAFVMRLFARKDCPNPKEFVFNRLNRIGQDQRIHKVEMYLLSYSLSVMLQVVHFTQFGSSEFVTYYPDSNISSWKQIALVAEDELQFNIPTR